MLKMKCSNCDEMIISALLSDVDKTVCGSCGETVAVENVLVYAEGFTFHRNDLIKRLFRYKTLLNEVRKEKEELEKNPNASEDSIQSLERFLQALEEVMAGARNNIRLDFAEPVSVTFKSNAKKQSGYLLNLSMSGACIEVGQKTPHPDKKGAITITFALPGRENEFSLPGIVSWAEKGKARKKNNLAIGIKFKSIDQGILDALWDVISAAVRETA
jgi:hypothetical protein